MENSVWGGLVYLKMAARQAYKSLVQKSLIGLDIGVTESVSGRPAKTKILLLSLDPCL